MVGKGPEATSEMASDREIDRDGLEARIVGLPGFDRLRDAVERCGVEARVIGGAVRDALLGRQGQLDVVTDGDPLALAEAIGGEVRAHERFATATVQTDAGAIDVVRARSETYASPGALPEVAPAGFAEDVERRDFTVNTMAVSVLEPGRLIDPLDGERDLRRRALRALHDGSFVDDPTRALRAARYTARLGLVVEPGTLARLRATDLATVSADRVTAELWRLAGEPTPRHGFELLDEWGLIPLADGAAELIDAIDELLARQPWSMFASREAAIVVAARGELESTRELIATSPASASAVIDAVRGRDPVELILARAAGASWLDRYAEELRHVALEITGAQLLAAGVPEGPAVGRGLAAALRAKLDGEAPTRDAELRIALETARS